MGKNRNKNKNNGKNSGNNSGKNSGQPSTPDDNSGNNSGQPSTPDDNSGNNSGNNSGQPSTPVGNQPTPERLAMEEMIARERAKLAQSLPNIVVTGTSRTSNLADGGAGANRSHPSASNQGAGGGGANRRHPPASNQGAGGGGPNRSNQLTSAAESSNPASNHGYQGASGSGANSSHQPNYAAIASNQTGYQGLARGGGANRSHQPTGAAETSNPDYNQGYPEPSGSNPAYNEGYLGASGSGANSSQQRYSGVLGRGQNPGVPARQPGPRRSPVAGHSGAGPSNYRGGEPGSSEGNPGGAPAHFNDGGDVRYQFGRVQYPAAGFPPPQPAGDQVDELRDFIQTRLREFFRPGRENDPSYEAAVLKDLTAYLEHPEGIDSLLPAKPLPTQNSQANQNQNLKQRLDEPKVYANSYGLVMESKDTFFLYKVHWIDFESVPSDVKEKNWKSVVEVEFKNVRPPPYFDGLQSIVLSKVGLMPSETMDYNVAGDAHNRVRVNFKATLNADDLHNYLIGRNERNVRLPQDVVKFANSVMKGYCKEMKFIESERHFFLSSEHEDAVARTANVAEWPQSMQRRQGFFQSVRVLECGLAMNVDFTSAAFWRPLHRLKQVWNEVGNRNFSPEDKSFFRDQKCTFSTNPGSAEFRQQVRVANGYLRNLKIVSTHRDAIDNNQVPKRRFNIYRVENASADRQTVILNRNIGNVRAGGQMSLVELLCNRDGYKMLQSELDEDYPALKVSKTKDCYVPWGCCFTGDESRVAGQLDGRLLSLLKMPITERHKNILNFRSPRIPMSITLPTRQEVYTQISVKQQLLEVKPIALKSEAKFTQQHGQFVWPAEVFQWAYLSFNRDSEEYRNAEGNYLERLKLKGQNLGMTWTDQAAACGRYPYNPNLSAFEKRRRLKSTVQRLIEQSCAGIRLNLIICFMGKKSAPEYATLKFLLDVVYGVPSQVILIKVSNSPKDVPTDLKLFTQLLKINVKCGGQNFGIEGETLQTMEENVGLKGTTILMGADVFHPKTDDDTYSIAAVTATTGDEKFNYATRLKAMERNTEIMKEILSGMVKELILGYRFKMGYYPKNIIFFRDGLSDSQYLDCLRVEGTAILQAVKEIQSDEQLEDGANFDPNVAIILAIKRHHTRFFVLQKGKVENLKEGTVVSKTVTNLKDYDFFLASQKPPPMGTIRPTHYLVLLDQIKMRPGDGEGGLYHYVFNLCQTFQRCTNGVALVAPVSYAHLAAARAKLYMQDYKLEFTGHVFPRRDDPQLTLDAHPYLRDRLWYL